MLEFLGLTFLSPKYYRLTLVSIQEGTEGRLELSLSEDHSRGLVPDP
jgi:hypothetical protein